MYGSQSLNIREYMAFQFPDNGEDGWDGIKEWMHIEFN